MRSEPVHGVVTAGGKNGGRGRKGLDVNPSHAGQPSETLVGEDIECGGREIEIGVGTSSTAVSDSDGYGFSAVSSFDLFSTDGVVVGVSAVISRVSIE